MKASHVFCMKGEIQNEKIYRRYSCLHVNVYDV